jgi:glycosyltransferase involved in cell wall biosynthesis
LKIAVGIPVYNDSIFLERSIQNCLDIGYDNVVYLNDGSTDDSYDKLIELTTGYDHIKVINSNKNSVLSASKNRWEVVAEECKKFNPDWIMVRAVDEILSHPAQKLFKNNLYELDETGVNMVVFNYKHLWRSNWWYRADTFWAGHHSISLWKNNTGWKFNYGTGMHIGSHRPNFMTVKDVIRNINLKKEDEIVVIHYGMSSHDLLARKLDYQINTSLKIKKRAVGMPNHVPHPNVWNHFNGYKVAYERNITLEKVKQIWFKDLVPESPKPEIKSLYAIVKKYDLAVAEEYAKIYGR